MHYSELFIGGWRTRPTTRDVFESVDPCSETVWATFPDSNIQDVNDAVTAAKIAFEQGAWRHDGFLRARLLFRLADLLEREAPRLGAIESRDNGKTVREAEAIALANQSEFSLASGIWTSNLDHALNFSRVMRAGTVWVNSYRLSSPAAPFGGFKRSGIGRERGKEALYEYLQVKNVMIALEAVTRLAGVSRV